MNLHEFFIYFDAFLFVLFGILLWFIITRIAPRTYKFYKQKYFSNQEFKKYGYFTDGGFWKWLTSQEGWIDLYQDAQEQKIVYYNNFRFFNIIWRFTFVLLCFRVLVLFFAPDLA